jgi:hypothetical protein
LEKRGNTVASEWIKLNERLQIRRDELNAYVNWEGSGTS